jgi:hypothetical protein
MVAQGGEEAEAMSALQELEVVGGGCKVKANCEYFTPFVLESAESLRPCLEYFSGICHEPLSSYDGEVCPWGGLRIEMQASREIAPVAIWSSEFTVMSVKLRCYVLNNGVRVINCDDVEKLLDAMTGDQEVSDQDEEEVKRFSRWQRGLEP